MTVDPVVARFAAWMAGSAEGGRAALEEAAAPPGVDREALLAAVFRVFRDRKIKAEDLDDVLRSDTTVAVELEHPLIRGDVRRLYVLQRELQRACLTATLGRLSAGRRAAFILTRILGFTHAAAAAILDSTEGGIQTAVGRAERELEMYLGPRCEHLDPRNFCRCAPRLGGAIHRGFVGWPERDDLASDGPLVSQGHRDVATLYASLPAPL